MFYCNECLCLFIYNTLDLDVVIYNILDLPSGRVYEVGRSTSFINNFFLAFIFFILRKGSNGGKGFVRVLVG